MLGKVEIIKVQEKDDNCRLDRWFKRYYPHIGQGLLQKWLRKKEVCLNGKKTETSQRVFLGDEIRIPPMEKIKVEKQSVFSKKDEEFIQSCVIYKDDFVIAINKPAGIAVQGGSKTMHHIDGMLDGLCYGKERPKLVHRLDKETSGVLILARTSKVALFLTKAFQSHQTKKIYWALVEGCPPLVQGKIDLPLLKKSGKNGCESVQVDLENGQKAITLYRVEDTFGKKVTWLEMMPLTGRTHQLRVHCATMNCPILGDQKYGNPSEFIENSTIPRRMYLHAMALCIPHPSKGILKIFAPLSKEMKNSFDFFGFNDKNKRELFEDV